MKHFGLYSACFTAVFLCSSFSITFAAGKDGQDAKPGKPSSQGSTVAQSSSRGGLPSLNGLVHGLGLGLRRRRRAVGNKVTNQKPTDKDSKCICPTQYEPICASDGKTYPNKCMFQCEVTRTTNQLNSKNSKKNEKVTSLKIIKKGTCTILPSSPTSIANIVNGTLLEHLPVV